MEICSDRQDFQREKDSYLVDYCSYTHYLLQGLSPHPSSIHFFSFHLFTLQFFSLFLSFLLSGLIIKVFIEFIFQPVIDTVFIAFIVFYLMLIFLIQIFFKTLTCKEHSFGFLFVKFINALFREIFFNTQFLA